MSGLKGSDASPAAAATTGAILESLDSLLRLVAGQNAPDFLGIDVTMSQAKVLHVTMLRPGISMSALAAELKVGPSAISGIVDRLVEHGYLERREDRSDRRQQLVTLTPEGQDVVARIREFGAGHIRPLLSGLDQAELEALLVGMTALERQARATRHLDPSHVPPSHERTPA